MGMPISIKNSHPIIISSESSPEIRKEKTQNNSELRGSGEPEVNPKCSGEEAECTPVGEPGEGAVHL